MSIIKRRYSKSEKMAIVLESQVAGEVIEELAERYAIHANIIRRWRRDDSAFDENASLEAMKYLPKSNVRSSVLVKN